MTASTSSHARSDLEPAKGSLGVEQRGGGESATDSSTVSSTVSSMGVSMEVVSMDPATGAEFGRASIEGCSWHDRPSEASFSAGWAAPVFVGSLCGATLAGAAALGRDLGGGVAGGSTLNWVVDHALGGAWVGLLAALGTRGVRWVRGRRTEPRAWVAAARTDVDESVNCTLAVLGVLALAAMARLFSRASEVPGGEGAALALLLVSVAILGIRWGIDSRGSVQVSTGDSSAAAPRRNFASWAPAPAELAAALALVSALPILASEINSELSPGFPFGTVSASRRGGIESVGFAGLDRGPDAPRDVHSEPGLHTDPAVSLGIDDPDRPQSPSERATSDPAVAKVGPFAEPVPSALTRAELSGARRQSGESDAPFTGAVSMPSASTE